MEIGMSIEERTTRLNELREQMLKTATGRKNLRVADGIIAGLNQAEAYSNVYGSKTKEIAEAACSRMLSKVKFGAAEYIEHTQWLATSSAAQKLQIDEYEVLKSVKSVLDRCMQSEPVIDRKGQRVLVENADGEWVPAYTFNASGALRAAELLGKHLGMFKDKAESPQNDPMREVYEFVLASNAARTSPLPSGL